MKCIGQHRHCAVLLVVFMLVATLTTWSMPVVAQTTPAKTVKLGILEPLTSMFPGVALLAQGVAYGTRGAIIRANKEGGVHGVPVELINKTVDFYERTYYEELEKMAVAHPDLLAMVNMIGNFHINMVKPLLLKYNLPNLSPTNSDPIARGYFPHNVFTRPDPWAEIVALVHQAVSKFRIKRLAFMYTANYPEEPSVAKEFAYGLVHRRALFKLMEQLGLEIVAEFVYDFNAVIRPNETTFDMQREIGEFLGKKPEAVFMFPGPDQTAAEFFIYCLAHPLANVFAPDLKFFFTESIAVVATLSIAEAKKMFPTQLATYSPKNRFFCTFTYPLSSDTSYDIVNEYHADMSAFFGDEYLKVLDYTTIAAYISTRWIIDVLRRTPNPPTRQKILDTIYSSSIWEVSDITYGIFKADCKRSTETYCKCNEGARLIDIGTLDDAVKWTKVVNGSFSWPYAQCSGRDIKLKPPTNYLQLFDTSDSDASELASLLRNGKAGAESTSTLEPTTGDIISRRLSEAEEVNRSLLVTTVAHSIVDENDAQGLPWPLIDPFTPVAHLARESSQSETASASAAAIAAKAAGTTSSIPPFNPAIIHVHSTLQQEFHVAAAYAADAGASTIHLVKLQEDAKDNLFLPFSKSAVTFRIAAKEVPSWSDLASGTAIAFVCGISTASQVKELVALLKGNRAVTVFIAGNEFQAHYSALKTELAATPAAMDRLLVATNLPHWGMAGAKVSQLVADYHNSKDDVNATNAHPLELRSFIATRALITVIDNIHGKVTPETVLDTLYDVSLIFVDSEVVLGPYFKKDCGAVVDKETCECNIGARKMRVMSLGDIHSDTGSPTIKKELTFSSCRIVYTTPPPEGKLSTGTVAGLSVGGAVVFGLVLFAASLFANKDKARDTSNAPKNAEEPYTLVFTDIQSSTSLWARAPEQMGPALDTHHEIIRQLIKKYHGYEVKTIGDAFMIAFSKTDDAVSLCEELQSRFHKHDWGTTAIDDTYKQLEQEALEEDPDSEKAISCNLPEALYNQAWNGLRVRCGVHTGIGDIKFDEITKGYDYYGNVPNVAARTEAIGNGGQICLTSFAVDSLKDINGRTFTKLGPVPLRGVTNPVEMFQLNVIPGRNFAPLRVDKGMDENEGNSNTGEDSSATETTQEKGSLMLGEEASQMSAVSGIQDDVSQLKEALNTLFSTLDIDSRRSVLMKIGTKWRVSPSHGKRGKSNGKEGECNEMINALSQRVYGVLGSKRRQNAHNQAQQFFMTGTRQGINSPQKHATSKTSNGLVAENLALSPSSTSLGSGGKVLPIPDLPGQIDDSGSPTTPSKGTLPAAKKYEKNGSQ